MDVRLLRRRLPRPFNSDGKKLLFFEGKGLEVLPGWQQAWDGWHLELKALVKGRKGGELQDARVLSEPVTGRFNGSASRWRRLPSKGTHGSVELASQVKAQRTHAGTQPGLRRHRQASPPAPEPLMPLFEPRAVAIGAVPIEYW